MGWWKTERGIGGDGWADEVGRCMKSLAGMARGSGGNTEGEPTESHVITMKEFADLVEFCSRGHLVVDVRHFEKDGGRPLSELHTWGVETYSNRGQIHCPEECTV